MPATDPRYERISRLLSDRTAELLASPTLVVSPEGRVVASSRAEWQGLPLSALEPLDHALPIPFRFGGQESRVLILQGGGRHFRRGWRAGWWTSCWGRRSWWTGCRGSRS